MVPPSFEQVVAVHSTCRSGLVAKRHTPKLDGTERVS
jgi:hypothetical protein